MCFIWTLCLKYTKMMTMTMTIYLHTEFSLNILNCDTTISVPVRLQNKWVQRSGILLPV